MVSDEKSIVIWIIVLFYVNMSFSSNCFQEFFNLSLVFQSCYDVSGHDLKKISSCLVFSENRKEKIGKGYSPYTVGTTLSGQREGFPSLRLRYLPSQSLLLLLRRGRSAWQLEQKLKNEIDFSHGLWSFQPPFLILGPESQVFSWNSFCLHQYTLLGSGLQMCLSCMIPERKK